ncbi:uncharacterized protein LOC124830153 [Vigna umbellata]|uniref:uncharacterized protein LOC124830153 n=1 Tax=Vigna umbellata TaxID=87088 RepID=UPI001F5FB878|nr:uncharacterized protein LOC124830153 [Vigna umbellata]
MKNSSTKFAFGLEEDECPRGTVPIRRITKANLIQSKLLFNDHVLGGSFPGVHVAEVYMGSLYGPYYKVTGINSIYNPKIERKEQLSFSYMWVRNGPIDAANKISVGWHVAPQIYGDSVTYIFAAWTSDNFKKTGCYNIYCSGFVQTDPAKYLGSPVNETSTYGGTMIELPISISQDPKTNNWWLNVDGANIGYFPSKLFSNMNSADEVGWGGRTITPANTPSPPMGSAYFPDKNFVHACYFREVSFQNESRHDYGPRISQTRLRNDNSDCFGVDYYGNLAREVGYSLQFGGPGGKCDN